MHFIRFISNSQGSPSQRFWVCKVPLELLTQVQPPSTRKQLLRLASGCQDGDESSSREAAFQKTEHWFLTSHTVRLSEAWTDLIPHPRPRSWGCTWPASARKHHRWTLHHKAANHAPPGPDSSARGCAAAAGGPASAFAPRRQSRPPPPFPWCPAADLRPCRPPPPCGPLLPPPPPNLQGSESAGRATQAQLLPQRREVPGRRRPFAFSPCGRAQWRAGGCGRVQEATRWVGRTRTWRGGDEGGRRLRRVRAGRRGAGRGGAARREEREGGGASGPRVLPQRHFVAARPANKGERRGCGGRRSAGAGDSTVWRPGRRAGSAALAYVTGQRRRGLRLER